jgi:hypothetical protein
MELIESLTADSCRMMTPEQRKAKIKQVRYYKRIFDCAMNLLEKTCVHAAKEIPGDYYARDKWRSDSAYCAACGLDMGWYCPVSLTHICDYEQEDGTFDSDHCIHCHMPDERK